LSGVGDEKDFEVSLDGVMIGGTCESEEHSAMCQTWLVLFHMLSPLLSTATIFLRGITQQILST